MISDDVLRPLVTQHPLHLIVVKFPQIISKDHTFVPNISLNVCPLVLVPFFSRSKLTFKALGSL